MLPQEFEDEAHKDKKIYDIAIIVTQVFEFFK
jgi:hypothetical protein